MMIVEVDELEYAGVERIALTGYANFTRARMVGCRRRRYKSI